MAKYRYDYMNERGNFYGFVEDRNGTNIWEVKYPDFYEDEETGEIIEASTIFEHGFMKDADDIEGLEKYLKDINVIEQDDEVTTDDLDNEEDENEERLNDLVDEYDIPAEVIREYASDRGIEIKEIDDLPFNGRYDSEEDYAEQMVEDGVVSNLSYYLEMNESDKETFAQEKADSRVDDMDDDDLLIETGKDDDVTEENREDLIEEAREELRQEYYEDIYSEVDKDAVGYFQNELGYDIEDLVKNRSFSIDYTFLARELGYDVLYIHHDGEVFVFSNYERGGMTYAQGGGIPNNYKGKTTESIWNMLTENQRVHFLLDHADELGLRDGKELSSISRKDWSDLRNDIKMNFKTHTMMGQYASGGSLETKLKGKLKDSFALPLEVAVYVPSTKKANEIISKKEFNNRINEVETYLSKLFGGYSASSIDGGYMSDDKEKGLIQEDVARVVSFGQKDGFEDKFDELINKISDWCRDWSQESIGLEFEGDMFYVSEGAKFGHGGITMAKGGKTRQVDLSKYENIDRIESYFYKIGNYWYVDGYKMKHHAQGVGHTKKEALEDLDHHLSYVTENDEYAKGGNIPTIEKRVAEVNAMINEGNEKGLEVVDESTTWQSPMKFNPLKYSNGVLYVSYKQLDLYKYNKGMGTEWKKENYKVGKNDMNTTNFNYSQGSSQKETLSDIARMYRKALNNFQKYGYADGGMMAKGGGFDPNGNPYGFDEMDSVYEWHYKEDDKVNPYKVWDKMEGVYVADFPNRQRAIEWIERRDSGYADGGDVKNPTKKQMLDYLNMYFDYYSELRTIAIEEDNILTKKMLPTLDDEQIEMAYEDAKYEIKADTEMADGGAMSKGAVSDYHYVSVSKKVNPNNINEFISYCNEFYGKSGIYAKDLKGGFSVTEIKKAVLKYLEKLGKQQTWGDGDSLDRERVREILESKMADGGVTFDDKVESISKSLLKRKKVSPKVQKDYGKTYDKKEAIESAKRIAGAMRKKKN